MQARLRQLRVVVLQTYRVGVHFDARQLAQFLDVLGIGLDGVAQPLDVGAARIGGGFDRAVVLIAALLGLALAAMQLVVQALILVDHGGVQFPVAARQACFQAVDAQRDLVRVLMFTDQARTARRAAPALRQVTPGAAQRQQRARVVATLFEGALVIQAQTSFRFRQGKAGVLPHGIGAGACHGGVLDQRLQLTQAGADFGAFFLQRHGIARRFVEFRLTCRQLLGRVHAGDASFQRADFGRQFADGQRQRIFLRFQCRQRLLDRFHTLRAAGGAEAVARRFHEQRAAAAALAVVGLGRDPLFGVTQFEAFVHRVHA